MVATRAPFGLSLLLLTSHVAAEPRVVVEEGMGRLCWEDGKVSVSTTGYGYAPKVRVEDEAAMFSPAQLISLEPLVSDAPADELPPPTTVQPSTQRGRVDLTTCDVRWEEVPSEPAGQPRTVTFLPPASEPYRKLVRNALGRPNAEVEHLLRIDLDGDGTHEVVFSGSYVSKISAAHAAWFKSIGSEAPATSTTGFVGISLAGGGGPRVRILARREGPPMWAVPGAPIAAVTDLNGDGALELVVGLRGDHWQGYDFVRIQRSAVHSTLRSDTYW
jgi:hypothetical protein